MNRVGSGQAFWNYVSGKTKGYFPLAFYAEEEKETN